MNTTELKRQIESDDSQIKITALKQVVDLDDVAPFAVSLIGCFQKTGDDDEGEQLCELATSALEAIGKPLVSDLPEFNRTLASYLDDQSASASSAFWAITMIGSLGDEVRLSEISGEVRTNLETAYETAPDIGVKKRSEWALKRITQ